MALLRTLIAVGAVVGGLLLATPAQASGPPVGSCPDSYSLVSASIQPATDANGDGQVCFKTVTPTDQPFGQDSASLSTTRSKAELIGSAAFVATRPQILPWRSRDA